MKDSVIQLKTGVQYYILEELEYKSKKYAYALQCNLETDTIDEENHIIMEIRMENDNMIVDEIQDDNLAIEIAKEFQKKFQTQV